MSKNKGPRVLILDIETSPLLSYTWGIWDQNVALNQIAKEWHILSFAAKWLGEKKVFYKDQRGKKNIEDDSALLKSVWKLIDQADILLTQNGRKFDVKKLNARFIMHGMHPPSSFKHIDALVLAKKYFAFTSNKLEYMTDKLCTKYKKSHHKKFAGFTLWKECLTGNLEAWNVMEKYNKYDILSLEELYNKLIPWDGNNTVNFNHYTDTDICKCGSDEFNKYGFSFSKVGKFQRYKCARCGAESKSGTNLFDKERREKIRR